MKGLIKKINNISYVAILLLTISSVGGLVCKVMGIVHNSPTLTNVGDTLCVFNAGLFITITIICIFFIKD
jgi:hypothetical protein